MALQLAFDLAAASAAREPTQPPEPPGIMPLPSEPEAPDLPETLPLPPDTDEPGVVPEEYPDRESSGADHGCGA